MSGFQKGKIRKVEGRVCVKDASQLKVPGHHFSWMGGSCNSWGRCHNNGCPTLCLHLCDQKQQSEHRSLILDGQGVFVSSGSHKLSASCSRNKCTADYFGAGVGNG